MSERVTLSDLRAANVARQAEWCPDQVPDLSFRGNELGGECGEAQNIIKKLERERHGWRGSRASLDDLAQELADVVICADLCAMTAGVDLAAAVVAKFNATSEKVGLATRLVARSSRKAPPFRAGDIVLHRPSGETWTVAYADPVSGNIAWCGWPPGVARIADCELLAADLRASRGCPPDLNWRLFAWAWGHAYPFDEAAARAYQALGPAGDFLGSLDAAVGLVERLVPQADIDLEHATWRRPFVRAYRCRVVHGPVLRELGVGEHPLRPHALALAALATGLPRAPNLPTSAPPEVQSAGACGG